ncbi:hypothetical protein J6590_096663 [Homalodisca vitripennis]|nr:hypothetical protein J6590_096663 [Homalodisca vitripennis]
MQIIRVEVRNDIREVNILRSGIRDDRVDVTYTSGGAIKSSVSRDVTCPLPSKSVVTHHCRLADIGVFPKVDVLVQFCLICTLLTFPDLCSIVVLIYLQMIASYTCHMARTCWAFAQCDPSSAQFFTWPHTLLYRSSVRKTVRSGCMAVF